MKKLIALLLCLTLVFGLVACTTGDTNKPADGDATDAPAEATQAPAVDE